MRPDGSDLMNRTNHPALDAARSGSGRQPVFLHDARMARRDISGPRYFL
jgi:hypothetical protein